MVHAFASIGFLFAAIGGVSVIAMTLVSYRIAILTALGVAPDEISPRFAERRIRVRSVQSTPVIVRAEQRRVA